MTAPLPSTPPELVAGTLLFTLPSTRAATRDRDPATGRVRGGGAGPARSLADEEHTDRQRHRSPSPPTRLLGPDEALAGLATRMHSAWVAFARTGDPGWAAHDLETRTMEYFG